MMLNGYYVLSSSRSTVCEADNVLN